MGGGRQLGGGFARATAELQSSTVHRYERGREGRGVGFGWAAELWSSTASSGSGHCEPDRSSVRRTLVEGSMVAATEREDGDFLGVKSHKAYGD
jgi:hypothetical protein